MNFYTAKRWNAALHRSPRVLSVLSVPRLAHASSPPTPGEGRHYGHYRLSMCSGYC